MSKYMIRITDGAEQPISYDDFVWNKVGEWTEAPDWNKEPVCGGGLHGQAPEAGGSPGTGGDIPELLITKGRRIKIDDNKIKVKRAKRIAVGDLSKMPKRWKSSLNLSYTKIAYLPKGLKVGGDLFLAYCTELTKLPEGLKVGGFLDLGYTNLTKLPEGLKVGGDLCLSDCINLTELPEGLRVAGSIYIRNCVKLIKLPKGLKLIK